MDFPVWPSTRTTPPANHSSFNPCSYGFPCMTIRKRLMNSAKVGFQSLFLWISLYDLPVCLFPAPSSASFNPCSYGFPCMTPNRSASSLQGTRCFNPCSYGFPCMTIDAKPWPNSKTVFQSLFLWISLYDPDAPRQAVAVLRGFNPCSYGFPCMTVVRRVGWTRVTSFQSLFLWISLYDVIPSLLCKERIYCFNPCSYGFPCMTTGKSIPGADTFMFQSLFLWISLYDNDLWDAFRAWDMVSILVLMDFPVWRTYQIRIYCVYGVSILVLMDFPVWHLRPHTSLTVLSSFNPCSYGFPCMTGEVSGRGLEKSGFQSLFLWISLYDVQEFPGMRPCIFCFNPCSYGFPCMTPALRPDTANVNLFQSLFLWISLYDHIPM